MKKETLDFYGQKVTIEYEGDENPLNFTLRQLIELQLKLNEFEFKSNLLEKSVALLLKEPPVKPERKDKEQDKAFEQRTKDYESELKNYPIARSKIIDNVKKLLIVLAKIKPMDVHSLKPNKKYNTVNPCLYDVCTSEVISPKTGKKVTTLVDIDALVKNHFIVEKKDE